MAEPPAAHVAHAIPGRVRLRVPAARGYPDRLDRMRRKLSAHHGVRAVEVDHRTGSVLVLGDVALHALADAAEADGLFRLIPPQALKPVEDALGLGIEQADARIRGLTGGRVGLFGLTVAFLVAVAAIQAYRGRVGAPAASLLWYAFTTALMVHSGRRAASG